MYNLQTEKEELYKFSMLSVKQEVKTTGESQGETVGLKIYGEQLAALLISIEINI